MYRSLGGRFNVFTALSASLSGHVLGVEDEGEKERALGVVSVTYSPDGSIIASFDNNHAKIWDAATGECRLTIEATRTRMVCLTNCGRYIMAGCTGLVDKYKMLTRVFDVSTGDCKIIWDKELTTSAFTFYSTSANESADGTGDSASWTGLIVSGERHGTLRVYAVSIHDTDDDRCSAIEANYLDGEDADEGEKLFVHCLLSIISRCLNDDQSNLCFCFVLFLRTILTIFTTLCHMPHTLTTTPYQAKSLNWRSPLPGLTSSSWIIMIIMMYI